LQLGFIIALLFSIIIAIFAILNNEVVTINYLFGSAPVSLVIVILASAFLGSLVVGIFSLVGRVKHGFKFRDLEGKLKKMEEELNRMKKKEEELLDQLYHLETQLYGEEEYTESEFIDPLKEEEEK